MPSKTREAPPVLEVDGLTKRFGKRTAVDNVSFAVERGDIYGFLGPNGAGKTTTMRMAVGLIRPTAGSVRLLGETVTAWHRAPLRKCGAIIESPEMYGYLSGRDNLRMLSELSGGCPAKRIDEILERVGLADRGSDPVRVYSQGMKRRLAIASALLPSPEVVLLDEPTSGLDPVGIRDVRRLIVGLARDEQLTVFLSSHLLAEVEQMCNRGAILSRGAKLWDGAVSELLATRRRIRLRATPLERAIQLLRDKLDVEPQVDESDDGLVYLLGDAIDPEDVVDLLVHNDCRVAEIAAELPPLEDVFVELVEAEEPS